MKLQLQRLRKLAGYKSQAEIAAVIGVPERRYASWEREEAMMSLEQAYNCAVALHCSIDEIAGREVSPRSYTDKVQERINQQYESMNERGRQRVADAAEDAYMNARNRKSNLDSDSVEKGIA